MLYCVTAALSGDTILTVFAGLLLGFILLFIGFLFFQSRANQNVREALKEDLAQTQNELFSNAADMLAKKLIVYTDRILVEKVNTNYERLIADDLLPAVNNAAIKITELSEAVTARQEQGMVQLADKLSELLAAKTRDYIRQEAIIITSLQENTGLFSKELSQITANTQALAENYQTIYQQSTAVSAATAGIASALTEKVSALTGVLGGTLEALSLTQSSLSESSATARSLGETTLKMQKIADDSAAAFSTQNEKIAALLSDAISSMQENTQQATKLVLEQFGTQLSSTTESISFTITALQGITDSIKSSADQFAGSLSDSYATIGSSIEAKIAVVTDKVSENAASEYEKIMHSAETYSSHFSAGLSQLNNALEMHISNLQTVTQQLNNNVSSFKNDVDTSSSRFELGMEKSVSDALSQMDASLAEIVKRLVAVTSNIQEAADALPKAINAIK